MCSCYDPLLLMYFRQLGHARAFLWKCVHGPADSLSNPPPPKSTNMLLVAHRGGCADAPENTAAAFRRAFDLGFRAVELDVRRTADNEVVVIHDATLRRTCSHQAPPASVDTPLCDMRWEEVQQVPIGEHEGKVQYPILLRDAFGLLPRNGVMFVEIKGDDMVLFDLVAEEGSKYSGEAELRYIAFNLEGLKRIKKRLSCKCYLVCRAFPFVPFNKRRLLSQVEEAANAGLDGVDVNAEPTLVTRELVSLVHAKGLEMVVWRYVGWKETGHLWSLMADLGVDAFTSDLPPDMLKWNSMLPRTA